MLCSATSSFSGNKQHFPLQTRATRWRRSGETKMLRKRQAKSANERAVSAHATTARGH